MGLKETLQSLSYFPLLIGVQVGVGLQSGFYIFMSQPLTNQQWGEPHFDQQARMAMAEVMNSDNLDTAFLTASLHLMFEIVLCHSE